MDKEQIEEEESQEETPQEPQEEEKNPLQMSDEDILNMSPEEFEKPKEEEEIEEEPEEEEEGEEPEPEPQAKAPTFTEEGTETKEESIEEEETTEEVEAKEPESLENSSEIDYKTEYEKLLAPFNASGAEHQVKNVEEAVRLMQFGVDYHKKASTLKQLKRVVQPLEEHKLLTPENVSLFIDLVAKKDQNALKKVISDFGLDPMDIDTDDSSEYEPNTYTVDEGRLELDDVLDNLRNSNHYNNILEIVGNKWDERSKQAVAQQPKIMADLAQHLEVGIYDVVVKEVDRQRMLGSLTGMSDIEAYNVVGNQLAQQGALQGQGVQPQAPLQQPPAQPLTQQPVTPQQKTNPELKSKRKAAAATKSIPSGQKAPAKNPLNMSDDDFLNAGF